MEFDWIQQSEALVDLVKRSEKVEGELYSFRKFAGLIRYLCPEAMADRSVDTLVEEGQQDSRAWVKLLLEIPEEDRLDIFDRCLSDLGPYYPRTTERMLADVKAYQVARATHTEGDLDKLNRYLRRIDGAILAGRYSLALKLTNRCLMEYYRKFLKKHLPFEPIHYDLNLMSTSVVRYMVRYFRKYRIPYREQTLLLMTTVTSMLSTTVQRLNRKNNSMMIDKAVAIYARNNVKRIVRFLSKYL